MLYKNISDKPKYIVSGSVKTLVKPNGEISLSPSDLNHSGSNCAYFELVNAGKDIEKNNLDVVYKIVPEEKEDVDIIKVELPIEEPKEPAEEASENEVQEEVTVEPEVSDVETTEDPATETVEENEDIDKAPEGEVETIESVNDEIDVNPAEEDSEVMDTEKVVSSED